MTIIGMPRLLNRAIHNFRTEGFRATRVAISRWVYQRWRQRKYRAWLRTYDESGKVDPAQHRTRIGEFAMRPTISIIMPVYNVDERYLREALDSVRAQTYPDWELCIADDNSTIPHVKDVLEEFARLDPRVKVVFRDTNGHISAASNSALELVTGAFTALVDHDDTLAEDALFEVAKIFNAAPETNLIYSDEDKIDAQGKRSWPMFKPEWSLEMMRSMNMITHLCVFRTEILRKIGGFREGFEGSQDYDLSLRFVEQIDQRTIRHIPKILYHWRAIPGSVAYGSSEKSYAHDRARRAIREHYQRSGIDATVIKGFGELHRPIFALPEPLPKVSVLTEVKESDLALLLASSEYPNIEPVVDRRPRSRFERLNEAVSSSTGDVLIFVLGDAVAASPGWVRELVGRAIQYDIGPVGGKTADTNGRIVHAGYLLGVKDGIGRAHFGYPSEDHGEFMRLAVDQNFAAVSASFMAIRREVFEIAGGFDAKNFPRHADVALCLELYDRGYRTVWTPWAKIVVSSEESRFDANEVELLKQKWPGFFERDPFYNPNLSLESESFELASPPRTGRANESE